MKVSPVFIGIDLAWSDRNPSGGAVIQDGRLQEVTGELGGNQEILAFVRSHLDAHTPAVVAVDAPLRVPNESGARACDLALSAAWRSYHAGAYPANRKRLAQNGEVRGEAVVQDLVQHLRFAEVDAVPAQSRERMVCEVYPHPAMVSLFGLDQVLKYKARSNRSMEERRRALQHYRQLLASLRKADPPLKKTKALLTQIDIDTLRGQAWKAYEDSLDALLCAYVAAYLWRHGPLQAVTYGSVDAGHIIVPLKAAPETGVPVRANGE